VHRSGGAGEGVEGDDEGGGEEYGYHQIGEGARRHILRGMVASRVGIFSFVPYGGGGVVVSSGLPRSSPKTPTQSGERSKRGWAGLLLRYLIPSQLPGSATPHAFLSSQSRCHTGPMCHQTRMSDSFATSI
jgi:hypothetical protein